MTPEELTRIREFLNRRKFLLSRPPGENVTHRLATNTEDLALSVEPLLSYVDELARVVEMAADDNLFAAGLEQGRKEASGLRELLQEVEWRGRKWGTTAARCICCGSEKRTGHKKDCRLATVLTRQEGP